MRTARVFIASIAVVSVAVMSVVYAVVSRPHPRQRRLAAGPSRAGFWCRCLTEVAQRPLLASKYFSQQNLNCYEGESL